MVEKNTFTWQEKKQANARDEIKDTALAVLQEDGFESLSMHRIARELQTTTPALYYYFKNRDALINELAADALADLQATLYQARNKHREEMSIRQAYVIVSEFYGWARQHPALYRLLYEQPLPDYTLPDELAKQTVRSMAGFLEVCERANVAGMLAIPALALTPEMRHELQAFAEEMNVMLPPEILFMALTGWARLHGLITSEINGVLGKVITNMDRTFFLEARHLLEQIGFDYQRTI